MAALEPPDRYRAAGDWAFVLGVIGTADPVAALRSELMRRTPRGERRRTEMSDRSQRQQLPIGRERALWPHPRGNVGEKWDPAFEMVKAGAKQMLEEKVRDAIVLELQRQSETRPSQLRVEVDQDRLQANGEIDLQALATAIVGAVAGSP